MYDSLINRNEIRRLEKAAKDKDRRKLSEWAMGLEERISVELRAEYEKLYSQELQASIDSFIVANMYALYFSEETVLNDPHSLADFMADLFVTVDMFRIGEYKPEEYIEILKKEGITLDSYDFNKIYKDRLERLDECIKKYEALQEQIIKEDRQRVKPSCKPFLPYNNKVSTVGGKNGQK